MDKTIWKAVLSPYPPIQQVSMPASAEIISAHEQGGQVAIWFKCDAPKAMSPLAMVTPEAELRQPYIALVPTGGIVPEDGKFIGTVLMHGGSFVLHVFEFP